MMKPHDVILKAMAKRITWMAAAEIAGVSDRTMRRIKQRYEEFGYDGLFDQRRGRSSETKTAAKGGANPDFIADLCNPVHGTCSVQLFYFSIPSVQTTLLLPP
jgi:hypothetical protein